MAASTSPVFQKTFSLDPEILGPGSSLALEVGGSTDADVLLAIANNQPFPPRPTGVIDLAHISLLASGANPVTFQGGDTTVGFSCSAGVTAGLGIFDDPQVAAQSLDLGETPGLDLTIGAPRGVEKAGDASNHSGLRTKESPVCSFHAPSL
jgi:hypothetical protein